MKFKILLTLLFFSTIPFSIHAQKGKKDKDIQIIDFGADDNEDKPQSEYKGIIIKTNPIPFVFGGQWVEVEKEITDYISLQNGVRRHVQIHYRGDIQ